MPKVNQETGKCYASAGCSGTSLPLTCSPGDTFIKTDASSGQRLYACVTTDTWEVQGGAGGGVPVGAVVMIVSGSCSSTLGAGWAEETALNGKFVLGTIDSVADIGGTGGSDTVTSVLNHTHVVQVTDPGHSHTQQVMSSASGGLSGVVRDTSSNTVVNDARNSLTATTGITASTDNPAGGVASIDNRPAFVKVIFCRKT